MLAADMTFIEELLPYIGICVVISDKANNFSSMPAFSDPSIRQTGFLSVIALLKSIELIAMLVEVISRETI